MVEPLPDISANMLFHIGYHKTGSSFLQERLFHSPAHGFIRSAEGKRRLINRYLIAANSFYEPPADVIDQIRREAEDAADRHLMLVISHERLSGYPASGGFDSRLIADRLHKAFPHARALIVIREQKSFIRSMYSQYVTDGGDLSLRRFLNPPEPHICRVPGWDFDFAIYDRLIGYYRRLFGADRVLCLPFELLLREPQQFVDRIVTFCGGDPAALPAVAPEVVNLRRPLVMQVLTRVVNRFVFRSQLSPHGLIAARTGKSPIEVLRPLFDAIAPASIERALDTRMRRRIERAVADRYRESNRVTSQLLGMNLAELGYDCAS